MAAGFAGYYVSPHQKIKGKPRIKNVPFKKCSPHHFQIYIDGDLLDYWPTKAKWRFRGVTYNGRSHTNKGSVLEFYRDKMWEVEQLGPARCAVCKHWRDSDISEEFGECALKTTSIDDVHFVGMSDRCFEFEAPTPKAAD